MAEILTLGAGGVSGRRRRADLLTLLAAVYDT